MSFVNALERNKMKIPAAVLLAALAFHPPLRAQVLEAQARISGMD